jgi:hypothetical protein
MAEVRAAPVPRARTPVVWAWLAFYLVAAWLAASGSYALFGKHLPALLAPLAVVRDGVTQFFAATDAVSHAVAPATPLVIAFVIGALLVDALLVATIVLFQRTIRPRLAARIALRQAQGDTVIG